MQLDQKALDELARVICEACNESWVEPPYNNLRTDALNNLWREAAKDVLTYLQAVQPAPVVTTITAATIEKACTDPIEIWPTGWRETYPALASPNVGTVKARLLAALTATASAEPVATHRHKKRGSEYTLIGIGKMQASRWFEGWPDGGSTTVDMEEVAIYRGTDGQLWVRPHEEFEDGRFEIIAAPVSGADNAK